MVHESPLVLFAVLGMILTDFLSFRCLNPNPEERPDIVEVRCCAESLQCQTLHLLGLRIDNVPFRSPICHFERIKIAFFILESSESV